MNEHTTNTQSTATSILNYMMNRYMPFLCVAFLLFSTQGFTSWISYLIIGFMWFASYNSFKCGMAYVLCEVDENTNIAFSDDSDEDNIL